MQNEQFIDSFLDAIVQIVETIPRSDISRAIDLLYEAWQEGRTIFVMGNGGSASTASHFASDLNKMTIVPGRDRVRAVSLVDNIPWVSALTNDEGWANIYTEQLENLYRPGDVIIGISVHGGSGEDQAGPWSQNLLKAMRYVSDNGGNTIGFSGFDGGAMKQLADVCVVVPYDTAAHVESVHVALHHLVTTCLAEKIRDTKIPS